MQRSDPDNSTGAACRNGPINETDFEVAALETRLETLKCHGAEALAPWRWHHVTALARRSQGQGTAVRAVLRGKLMRALRDLEQRVASAARPPVSPSEGAVVLSPLAELLRSIEVPLPTGGAQQEKWRENEAGGAPPMAVTGLAPLSDLKSLQEGREVWSRLKVQHQIARSLAAAPINPGPLNSETLVLRALQRLNTLAPAYLEGFISQVETLRWIDARSQTEAQAAGCQDVRREANKPVSRGKPRKR